MGVVWLCEINFQGNEGDVMCGENLGLIEKILAFSREGALLRV